MFRATPKDRQLNLLSSTHTFLSGASLNAYEDPNGWHNLFREQITDRIDEEPFRPLFCQDNGAPNTSIRVLVSMMILKEARSLSDSELIEECRFNLLTRSALGLFNMDDPLTAMSTYYLLRSRIVIWNKSGNENLIEKVFSQVTKSQVIEFKINGKKIRLDSKLMGSNIAWYSRYELIHESVRKAYSCIKKEFNSLLLSDSDIQLLESICKESGDKVSYRSNRTEIESRLRALGKVIYKIIQEYGHYACESIEILCRVFNEQYVVKEEDITPRSKEEIQADSVQSPHDTDCHYRSKGDNEVKGYSVNVTETCDTDAPLNLITNVLVEPASAADCHFLQPAIEATQEIVIENTETVNADGAYHSVDNQDYCKEKGIDLILGAIQGKPSRYDLSYNENGELIITNLQTNTIIPSRRVTSRKKQKHPKWAIKDEQGKNRYFTQKEIDTCLLRKQIVERSQTELNVRNNVEATIFQLGYHYPNAKSRYRGLIKHKIWANLRCLWINFVRIKNFIVRNRVNYAQKSLKSSFFTHFLSNIVKILFIVCVVKNNRFVLQKK